MKYLQFVFITIGLSFILSSCIHEENNCAKRKAIVTVTDKNYSNIQEIDQAIGLSEDLPIGSYVSSLDLLWENLCRKTTGEMPIVLNPEEKTHTLNLKGFEEGKYKFFIASGNTLAEGTIDKTTHKIELHPNHTEHADNYSGMGSFRIPLEADQTIELFRLKGKLLVVFNELPAQITHIDITAANVSKTAMQELSYEGTTYVNKSFVRADAAVGEFLLAPSGAFAPTTLTVMLKNGTTTVATISNVEVSMERNKLAVIKPTYNPENDKWEIEMLIDGEWEQITNLDISIM